MAQIAIQADNGETIILVVPPIDALEILQSLRDKYPNAAKSNQSMQQFIDRWTAANQEQSEGRFKR